MMGHQRSFPPLSQDNVRIAQPGRAAIIASVLARLNAGHERLTAGATPGSGSRVFRPHNHTLDGGAVLGRGTIYSFDHGGILTSQFGHVLVATNTWETMNGATNREFTFPAFVSPNLTGSLSAVFALFSNGVAIDFRLANLDTATESTHTSTPALNPAWRGTITDIPFVAGQYNRFNLQCRANLGDQLDLLGFCLYEDTATHPASPGTTTYSAL